MISKEGPSSIARVVARTRQAGAWVFSTRGGMVIVGMITLFAFALRLWNLDKEPLHVDELKQVTEVQASLLDAIQSSYVISQPPLDYIVGWVAVQLGPATDFVQRLPAALFGTAAVGLIGLVLVRAERVAAAFIAAFFVAISPLFVELSQYARPYALPVAAVVATITLYQHWHLGARRPRVLVAFGTAAALALLSRPMMPVIALGTLGFIALARALLRDGLKSPLATLRSDLPGLAILPVTFALVWVPSSMYINSGFLVDCWRCNEWGRLATGVQNFGEFGGFAMRPVSLVTSLIVAVAVLVFPSVRASLGRTWYLWAPLLLTAPIFALVHALVLPPGTFFAIRYLVFLPVGLSVFLAIALTALAHAVREGQIVLRTAVVGVVALFALVNALSMMDRVRFVSEGLDLADWRSTAEYIEAVEQPGDVIVSIDTRPFSRETKFGFMSYPRYYAGTAPFYKPEQVILNPDLAISAGRYHFVLFVPKMAAGWDVPTDWEIRDYSEMTIITTSGLSSEAERIDAWWILADALRPDVAVTTRIAGGAVQRASGSEEYAFFERALEQAETLGQGSLAAEFISGDRPG